MEESKRVLFVNSEIFPYLPENSISTVGRFLPQGIQESGKEIRSFIPRYGNINERRNQLHEVIRLSGMNIIVNDIDRPLIIKVASIPTARMQVYFIDNDDYFHRKAIYTDPESGEFFEDNDERAVFFARGVLETVKKLRWKPDIVHCQGWISHMVPLYLKKAYKDDPIFTDSKLILSLYDEISDAMFSDKMRTKMLLPGIKSKDIEILNPANGINLAKLAIKYSDGIILGSNDLSKEVTDYVKVSRTPVLPYVEINQTDSEYIKMYNQFYDKILNNNAI